ARREELSEVLNRLKALEEENRALRAALEEQTALLKRLAQALAYLEGRDFLVPEDLKRAFRAAIPHRLLLRLEAELAGATPDALVEEALRS
ncbi:hypothetical protein L6232_24210, partial [Shewanella sp. C31]|nr:hypothetical protein [Shewanella electrica]